MSRQQISWRTFPPKFLDYPKFKAILDKIIKFASWAALKYHQHLHHLYWWACVCDLIHSCKRCVFNDLLCFRFYSHIYAVQFVVLRDFYQILWDMVSEVYVLNNCSFLYTMLATLTTIATPRYSGGVGVSGDVGRSLGPFVHCYF